MTIHSSGSVWTTSTRQVAQEVDAKFPRPDWTSTYPGHGEVYPSVSGLKGNDGRYAIDFMCSKAMGDKIAEYVWANRKRLGVRYVIWYGRIISETSSTPNRWVRYYNADNPNPSKSHKNHVHASRYSNKGYTGPATAEPSEPGWDGVTFPGTASFYVGVRGDYVTTLGQRLVLHGWTGYSEGPGPVFSEVDKAAVLWFQLRQGWTGANATGIPGPETWRRLMLAPAEAPPVVVDPPVVIEPEPVPPAEPGTEPCSCPTPVEPPPVEPPPVVTPPVVVEPPVVIPEEPAVRGITKSVQFISINAMWQGFGSVAAKVKAGKAKSWSTRKKLLAQKIRASKAKVVAFQELGQAEAAELAAELGKDWAYQRKTLNCVFWRTDFFDFVKVRDLVLPAFGQFPGRSYIEVWLKDGKGNRFRAGSAHLTVKTSNDAANQLAQIEKITSFVNDEDDDWPLVIGIDTNNKQAANQGMWVRLAKYGFSWDRHGIDAILWNYGVKITRTDAFELGDASDHDGRTAPVTTTKK